MISLASVRQRAKQIAQDSTSNSPQVTASYPGLTAVQILLTDPADYNEAVKQAVRQFSRDKQYTRTVDIAAPSTGFRFTLYGAGSLTELSGADAWLPAYSGIVALFWPWDHTQIDAIPLDANFYAVRQAPGGVEELVLGDQVNAADVIRMQFTRPHSLTEAENVVAAPAVDPGVTVKSIAGLVTVGSHVIGYSYLTEQGETTIRTLGTAAVVSSSGAAQIDVTTTVSPANGVTGRAIYMSKAGVPATLYRVGVQPGVASTAFTINVADSALTQVAPTSNTAGGLNTPTDYDEDPLALLAGSFVLQIAANKSVQNTGNTGLPNDIVDRRTVSDIFRSRAKDLVIAYQSAMGIQPGGAGVTPASAVRDLATTAGSRFGFLWPRK